MTLSQTCRTLLNLTADHKINGERFTVKRLSDQVSNLLRTPGKLGNRLAMTIQLPDGEWLMTINRYADRSDGWSYYIPETREQEKLLWNELFS